MKGTLKQKKAIAKIAENGGNVSQGMIDAGYSVATAHTPSKLTDSPVFQEYLESEGVTDLKLAQVLKEGLEATKTIVMGSKEDSFVDIQPDHPTRHKFLETGLKLKGHTKEAETPNTVINQILVKFINADH